MRWNRLKETISTDINHKHLHKCTETLKPFENQYYCLIIQTIIDTKIKKTYYASSAVSKVQHQPHNFTKVWFILKMSEMLENAEMFDVWENMPVLVLRPLLETGNLSDWADMRNITNQLMQ